MTPAIDRLLDRLRRRLVLEVWLHGVGRVLLATGLWLLAAFLIDWVLHVPAAVRSVHLAVLVALPIGVAWRELFRRLRCIPDRDGLAVLLERAHPELHELLVSAVQLGRRTGQDGADPQLIAAVVREAEERAAGLDLRGVTDPRPARRTFGLGAITSALVAVVFFVLLPAAARVFFARIAGGDTPWPQRTHLIVEIPLAGELHSSEDDLSLAVARSSDVPVLVRARGDVPEEVMLHFEGGQEVLLGRAGKDVFRTLLRSVQEDLAFHVSGGDDQDGTPSVRIEVLQPPDVTGIAVRITPPPYSGLPERVELDRDVQVLAGSQVSISMISDPADATGIARLLPEDRVIQLSPRPFPGDPQGTPRTARGFDLTAVESLRYRFELRDDQGLENPDPGLFALNVEPDRPPEVELFAPARGEIETVVGGSLPLRALVSDDFGLSELSWTTRATSSEVAQEQAHALATRPAPEASSAGPRPRAAQVGTALIDVDGLFAPQPPTEGEVFELFVVARDNREPDAQQGRSAPVRLRVVSADEFLRRIQDRLTRVRTKVDALADLLREKQTYTRDLISSLESDEPAGADLTAISTGLSGARRVQGDARALTRELAAIAEALLYSRLDERAEAMLAALDERASKLEDRSFHAELWQELTQLQADGALGKADFADKLLEIVGVALAVSEEHSELAVAGLRSAQDSSDLTATYDSLLGVASAQAATGSGLEELLRLLSEWDSYQSILSSTRDLLNRQKNLLERTRQFYKDN